MIKVKNVSMSYGKKIVLDDISFQIKKGDIVGLLGNNGAGKSTTMNLLTGYLKPKSGEVFINDINMSEKPKLAKKSIGYLPEIPPLYKDMKVVEYLQFVAELKAVKSVQSEINAVMERFDLTDKKYEYIKNLSKGWQQRVGFAQALLGEPEVIILDEPLVGLDPKESKEIRKMIQNLKGKHTVIISSHILKEIEEVCNQILIIKNGKIALNDNMKKAMQKGNQNKYKLVIKGEKNTIFTLLNNAALLSGVEYIKQEEGDVHHFLVYSKEKRDIRDNLFGLLVGKKLSVYGIEKYTSSLEEVYETVNEGEE